MIDSNTSPTEHKKFYKILIATDGSEASMNAADYAIEIARKCDSELTYISFFRI
ncbi:MAG TPA: universal stress protein [Nitrososphaeraceae archaeon]|nr:universal stress protein [Nitrososphaeraceae archaeon]